MGAPEPLGISMVRDPFDPTKFITEPTPDDMGSNVFSFGKPDTDVLMRNCRICNEPISILAD
jgi:hypothetical protein